MLVPKKWPKGRYSDIPEVNENLPAFPSFFSSLFPSSFFPFAVQNFSIIFVIIFEIAY